MGPISQEEIDRRVAANKKRGSTNVKVKTKYDPAQITPKSKTNPKWASEMRSSIEDAQKFLQSNHQQPELTPSKPKAAPVWSGWDENTNWKPEEGYNAVLDLGDYEIGCEDRPDMERPKIQMMVDDGEEE